MSDDDPFASTCTECLDPLDDAHPYGTTTDGDFVHYACADDDDLPVRWRGDDTGRSGLR